MLNKAPPVVAGRRAFAIVGLVCCLLLCRPCGAQQGLVARVVAGPQVNIGLDARHHLTVEERAELNPPLTFAIFTYPEHDRVRLYERIAPIPANPPRVRMYISRYENYTLTPSLTLTRYNYTSGLRWPKVGRMQYWVLRRPIPSLLPSGPFKVPAASDDTFKFSGMIFHNPGTYYLAWNATLPTFNPVRYVRFNFTVTVKRQPTGIAVLDPKPAGYNGTSLSPPPTISLTDALAQPVVTLTPLATLEIVTQPVNSTVRGSLVIRPSARDGSLVFSDITPSLPGAYIMRVIVTLSDGTNLATGNFRIDVQKALPVRVVLVRGFAGVAGFPFLTQPVLTLQDSNGATNDLRTNMTLVITRNTPSVQYEGLDTQGELTGAIGLQPVNYLYSFSNLAIDLPGNYELTANVQIATGDVITLPFAGVIDEAPTFDVNGRVTVNNPSKLRLYGIRPATSQLRLRMSSVVTCADSLSDIVEWTEEFGVFRAPEVPHNITFIPFDARAQAYLCMSLTGPRGPYKPLLRHHLQQFDELYPVKHDFRIDSIGECQKMPAVDSAMYRMQGWLGAEEGRRYGCDLKPPVAGTVPPCTCPAILKCVKYTDESFTPAMLNIGRCECCVGWVLAVTGVVTGAVILAVVTVVVKKA